MTVVRRLARPMLASIFVLGGYNAIRNADSLKEMAKPVTDKLQPTLQSATQSLPIDPDEKLLVQVNGGVQIVAGAMLATGRVTRPASLALAASLVPTTLAGHAFWEESDPQSRANQQIQFFKNVSLLGGLLISSVDTEGKPSTAWRVRHEARRAAKIARKRAGDLTSS